MSEQYWKERAEAAEMRQRALREALERVRDCHESEIADKHMRATARAALSQHSQDGERLDPYTLDHVQQAITKLHDQWRTSQSSYGAGATMALEYVLNAIRNLRGDQ